MDGGVPVSRLYRNAELEYDAFMMERAEERALDQAQEDAIASWLGEDVLARDPAEDWYDPDDPGDEVEQTARRPRDTE